MTKALLLAALALPACIGGVQPVACAFDSECTTGESCAGGQCTLGAPTCPPLSPTFTSINNGLFQVGCGAKSNKCHNSQAVANGYSGFDMQKDIYTALVNVPIDNIPGRPDGLLRVKPGDPAHSLMVIKLKLKGDSDLFGASMPFDNPGAICPSAVDTITQWVQNGAKND